MNIAIAGNIGSGKTTLTGLLAKDFGWEPFYEKVDKNPYLNNFYEDMNRWSFNLQIYFLNTRLEQVFQIRNLKKDTVQDRTIYEDAYIFAANLRDMGLMSSRDYDTYLSLFEQISGYIQPPDLLIYLRASVPTLVKQIHKRGREYEKSISIDYLHKLNEKYENFINNYKNGKIMVINVEEFKFHESTEDLAKVINNINANINGLFKL
ncbi:MAG: deoxynucleoside kinase [Bacteroidetes bacterium GWE2_29_8]|nr:MAG: deoxynucleoside kinase [Bacteroidetes bacterium GWE2_29_8]OFY14149.1 MAG: deoxynucleoside kinase [Bacteroidetes bacterium GWF2_29_10]